MRLLHRADDAEPGVLLTAGTLCAGGCSCAATAGRSKHPNSIPRARFTDLRHTFGTVMAGAGVPMRTLQEWMGHSNISTTEIYADYAPNPHEVAMAEAAFARGPVRGPNLSEPDVISEHLSAASTGDRT